MKKPASAPRPEKELIPAYHIEQAIQKLDATGFYESSAMDDWFGELFKKLKAARPKVQYVQDVGRSGVQQIIFLPRYRRTLVKRLNDEFERLQKLTNSVCIALQKIS